MLIPTIDDENIHIIDPLSENISDSEELNLSAHCIAASADIGNQKADVVLIDDVKTDAEIIDGYLNGSLTGVYVRQGCFFINIRVTGLGITRRMDEEQSIANLKKALSQLQNMPHLPNDLNKLCKLASEAGLQSYNFLAYRDVDRRPQEFADPKTLEMYAGLPILLDHPKDGLLTFKNLVYNSIVGSVVKAYKLNNSVFAIARIYDLSLLDKLDEFKSTSPAVVSIDVEENGQFKELPIIFNHLAFVRNGHWDQISDYAIDGSKILVEGETMDEILNVDSITDVVATPEAKEVKTDEVETVLDDETIIADNAIEIDADETEEVEEVKTDGELQIIHSEDPVVTVDDEEVTVIDEGKQLAGKKLAKEAVDEGITDVTKTVECDEDKERANLIDAMRQTVDAASSLRDVKMPYIEGRKKPSFVIKQLLRSNRQYVDSKYQGIIDSDASYKNYALCVDAFNNMLSNIKKADELNNYDAKRRQSQKRGWTVVGNNPNILVDRHF